MKELIFPANFEQCAPSVTVDSLYNMDVLRVVRDGLDSAGIDVTHNCDESSHLYNCSDAFSSLSFDSVDKEKTDDVILAAALQDGWYVGIEKLPPKIENEKANGGDEIVTNPYELVSKSPFVSWRWALKKGKKQYTFSCSNGIGHYFGFNFMNRDYDVDDAVDVLASVLNGGSKNASFPRYKRNSSDTKTVIMPPMSLTQAVLMSIGDAKLVMDSMVFDEGILDNFDDKEKMEMLNNGELAKLLLHQIGVNNGDMSMYDAFFQQEDANDG